MPARPSVALSPLLLLVAAASLHAQGLAVGGGGIYAGSRASGPGRLQEGYGFDAFAAVGGGPLSLAGGYQRSVQALRDVDTRVTLQGPYLEPRLALGLGRGATPYLTGRVALLRETVRGDVVTVSNSARTAVGAGLGFLVPLGPAINLDLAAHYTRFDVKQDTRAGDGALVRAGLVFGFPRY
ncbi:hypothetical protein [Roseisolibacter sp. H3M3-2]|uniref:hypothetical protein n=1 Tax=Roseisolibacter sp. H3M3-2 TaxID=3031323 RepID=UPI0023DC23B6|nr:hypothetical protein [Roseisolibacter sp. H3M3-2]MDF1501550.1 hypothetical protein [Roseisolibacter sp. H3M3-2]